MATTHIDAGVQLSIWYSVEAGYYIMANCLSRLRPLIVKVMPQWFINSWRRLMTSLGGVLRAPHLGLDVLPARSQDHSVLKDTTHASHQNNEVDHREWGESTAELGQIDSLRNRTVMGQLVSMSFMDDPYLLGPNSKTVGVSSWTIVGRSREERDHRSLVEEGDIQVTVEVSMRTNPRTRSWALPTAVT